MNAKLYTENELRDQMRSIFTAVFPNRSTDGLENIMSGNPGEMISCHLKKELILETAKLVLCAENHLDPASDQDALQNAIERIDEMVISIGNDYTDEEFYQAVKEKYGSRGVRQAKKDIARHDPVIDDPLSPAGQLQYRHFMMETWLDSKEEARQKFTPKKYRK